MPTNELMPRLIKTAKRAFRYTGDIPRGWPLDVYYDREAEVYVITDFPEKGQTFEVGVPLEDGFADIEVEGEKYKVRIYET